MNNFVLAVIVLHGCLLTTAHCHTINKRQETAFDPNQVMENNMDVRTDQGLFGSYHPNDLVQSIVNYFQQGNANTGNEWGFSVYNPTAAIGQYMGNGNGQQTDRAELNVHKPDSVDQSRNDVQSIGFNANALNQRLMQSLHTDGNSFISPNSHTNSISTGFNPDVLNRQMMQSVFNKVQGGSLGTDLAQNGATGTGQVATGNSGQLFHGVIGFNPDSVNAGLLNSLNYDPNVANSNLVRMPTFLSSVSTNNGNVLGANGVNDASSTQLTNSTKEGGATQTGQVANAGQAHVANIGQSVSSGQAATQTGASNTGNTLNGQGAQEANGGKLGGGLGAFTAGGLGPDVSQNHGLPPGIAPGTNLQQTDTQVPVVHGIGSMG